MRPQGQALPVIAVRANRGCRPGLLCFLVCYRTLDNPPGPIYGIPRRAASVRPPRRQRRRGLVVRSTSRVACGRGPRRSGAPSSRCTLCTSLSRCSCRTAWSTSSRYCCRRTPAAAGPHCERSTKETCASAKVANARPQAARRTLIFSSACEHVNTWRRWARAARGKM